MQLRSYELKDLLASGCCAGEDDGVVYLGQVPYWFVLDVDPWLCLGVVLCELCLDVAHDGAVDYEEDVW